ncbi:MAG: sulfatase-like hydrolase/transferase [Opitutaceae bacterium]
MSASILKSIKPIVCISLVCILLSALSAKQERPNVVWLTSEDNSANWYRLYNPEHGAPMPNIERLAAQGLVFNNAYSCAPVCSTARSTIISGVYGPRTGAQYHRAQAKVDMPEGLKLFPAYLRDAGYYTTNNYKQDYNYKKKAEQGVWDVSSKKASYRERAAGQPFFHVQNFSITHESRTFKGLPEGVNYIIPPSEVELFPYHPDTPLMRQKYAQYLTLNHLMDQQVGEFIDQLKADGLMDDTFIFHYGDHGGALPGGKGYAHNDGLQVAMVVYVPKNWAHLVPAPRGSRIDGVVEFVDLSATVLNLAGVKIPSQIDGQAFLGAGVKLDELNSRETAFAYADRFDEKYDMVRFLRKGRYSYWRSYQPFNVDGLHSFYRYKQPAFREWRDLAQVGELNAAQTAFYKPREPEQLYDLEKDPHELNNLTEDPAYTDLLLSMRREMQTRMRSMPDLSFLPETELARSKGKGTTLAKANKERISQLIRIADLQMTPFPEAKSQIQAALNSADPMERYWGLITCSAFGGQASPMYQKAIQLADSDQHPLVRTRAAEFLGLNGAADPLPILLDVLNQCNDPVEANLILNSVALLCESTDMKIDFKNLEQAQWHKLKGLVPHRVEYLKSLNKK